MATRVIWFISLSDLAYIWVGISYTYKCSVPVTLIIFENPFSKPELWYHVRLLLSLFLKPWGIGRRAYHDHTLYCNTRNILGGGCTWSYIIYANTRNKLLFLQGFIYFLFQQYYSDFGILIWSSFEKSILTDRMNEFQFNYHRLTMSVHSNTVAAIQQNGQQSFYSGYVFFNLHSVGI